MEAHLEQERLKLDDKKLQLEAEKAALGGLNDGNRLELSKYQTDVKAKGDAFKVKSDIIKETIKAKVANDKRSDDASRNS